MPIITLWTNLAASKLSAGFRNALLATVAGALRKPVDGSALIVEAGESLCQLGTDAAQPVVILNIKSIGNVTAEENIGHAKAISDFVEQQLGVPSARVMIHFQNLERHEVAKSGTTVEVLLGGK